MKPTQYVIRVRDRYEEDITSFLSGPFEDLELARLYRDKLIDKLADPNAIGDLETSKHLTQCRMSIDRVLPPGEIPAWEVR